MKLAFFVFVNFFICIGSSFAGDQLGEFIEKIKEVKYEKSLKDLWPIVDYLEKKKEFNAKELEQIKNIVLIYCEEKEIAVYLPSIIKMSLLLKKEDLSLIKPVLLKILEDPKQRSMGGKIILQNLDYLFDDYNGEMLLKYGELIKLSSAEFIVTIFYSSGKFNHHKFKTFCNLFVKTLEGNDKLAQNKIYRELKERFAFVSCLSLPNFEKSVDEIKSQELKKMKDWLVATTEIKVHSKFFLVSLISKQKA